jgi:hypothetical protein
MSDANSPFRNDARAITSAAAEPSLARWNAEPLPLGVRLALLVVGKSYRALRAARAFVR